MGGALVAGIAVVLIAAAVLSRLWTRSLVRPINEINLENPLQNRVYDELTPMLRRMAEQNRRLETQMREIDARRGELETIIGHMNEGLLILDAHRHVLLMNDSARAILHTASLRMVKRRFPCTTGRKRCWIRWKRPSRRAARTRI